MDILRLQWTSKNYRTSDSTQLSTLDANCLNLACANNDPQTLIQNICTKLSENRISREGIIGCLETMTETNPQGATTPGYQIIGDNCDLQALRAIHGKSVAETKATFFMPLLPNHRAAGGSWITDTEGLNDGAVKLGCKGRNKSAWFSKH